MKILLCRENFDNGISSAVIFSSGHSIVSTVVQSEVDEETGNSSKLVLESSLTIEKVKKPKKIPADEHENTVNGGDTEVTVEKRKKKKRSVDENVVEDVVGDAEKKVKKSKKVTAVEEAVEMISEKKSKKSKKVKE